ncbi:undecaprenyl-diphosphatase [Virgibacillus salexigens]|uniref:undecaprenyl-diphosphatase n=1 Tax=Virgibacillus massiliensis TaxID=1462526 RepID=UPI00136AC131|nr:undecaprenyl-diphosphatase [Virgibacillus massiliensis]MYL43638.1 phosphatase PAP2 family protein [Virgibacillus massiliensis]
MSISEINIDLFRMVNNLGKGLTYLNPTIVFVAKYMVFLLALAVIAFWFTRSKNNRMMIICGSITFVLAEIIGKIFGKIYSNNPPFAELSHVNHLIDHEIDNSFPSDHTILFFSFCITFFLFKKRSRIFWIMIAILVGLSRIWAGVHYPADVIVGAAISILVAILVYKVVPKLNVVRKLIAIYEKGEQTVLNKTRSKEN